MGKCCLEGDVSDPFWVPSPQRPVAALEKSVSDSKSGNNFIITELLPNILSPALKMLSVLEGISQKHKQIYLQNGSPVMYNTVAEKIKQ